MMDEKPRYDRMSQERTTGTSQSEEPKEHSVKQVFSKFADSTSMSGVSFIKNSKLRIAKAAWSLVLLVSLGALSVHLWNSLDQYYSYPKTAKINLGFANLYFPEITICNMNAVSKRRLDSYDSASVATLKKLMKALEPQTLSPEFFNESLSYSDIANYYSGSGDPDYYDSFWNDFGSAQFYDNYEDVDGSGFYYGSYDYDFDWNYNYYDNSGDNGDEYYETTPDDPDNDYGDEYGNSDYESDQYYDNTNDVNNGNDDGDIPMSDEEYENTVNGNDEVVESGDGGSENSSGNNEESGSGSGDQQPVKKRRRRRYAELYDQFNFTDFDPTFEDWFRHDKEELLSNIEFGAKVDTSTKIGALFRKTFMNLARWERGRLGHNITKMLLKCTFAGRKCDEQKRLFRLHQTAEYGNCWTLSSRKFLAQDAGPNSGLSLVLNLQSSDYLAGITHGFGARIQIHNRGAYPDPFQDGFSIPASMETSIGLKLVTFERLSGKYGDCEDGEAFRKQYKRPYTRRTCQIFCHATRIIETCGCYDEHTEEVAVTTGQGIGLSACNTTEQYDCVHRIQKAIERKEILCSCRNPCKESAFTKSISMHQWPSEEHGRLLLAGICAEDSGACKSFLSENNTLSSAYNNFLKLNIYYEDLNYEEIVEEPDIGLAQILSDVGGAIGLWIGLSVVSFCEVVQLFIELGKLLRYKLQNTPSRRKRRELKRKSDEEDLNSHFVPLGRGFNTNYNNISKRPKTNESTSYKNKSKHESRKVNSISNPNSSFDYNPFGTATGHYPFGNGLRRDFSLSGKH